MQQLLQHEPQIAGGVAIPDARAGVLIQPRGRSWRVFHEVTLPWIGGIAIIGMIVVLAAFLIAKGRIRIRAGFSKVRILRFAAFERFVHWLTAVSFVVLGLTGLNITFGKWVLLPILGNQAFSAMTEWGKYAHNFFAWPFMLGVVLIFIIWIKDNLPNQVDINWLRQGGGLVGEGDPPAERFNAGQKLIFWIAVLGGVVVSLSGLTLLFPFSVAAIDGMQTANLVHAVLGLLMIAIFLAHIYIGTLGMEGAFDAMGTGEVDLNWAKQHHPLWLEEEEAKKRIPDLHGQAPAE
ncbi:MAG: formate dehydrogenase subunit gamma [Acetobacteraceae bacterium]